MKLDNVPELEGEWTYRLGYDTKSGEVYYASDLAMWVNSHTNAPLTFRTIIATPVKPPRLNWHNLERGYWQELNYVIQVTGDGRFSAAERFGSHIECSPFASLQAAQAACQEHADKMHKEKAKR